MTKTSVTTISKSSEQIVKIPEDDLRTPQSNAATGASAAGMRAVAARVVAFYFRAPIKAFFRTRVDYMGYARAINPRIREGASWSWRVTTPGLIAHAVKTHGWGFIPNQLLPPLLANVVVGGVLYTSYLQVLGALHEPSSRPTKRIFPPPSFLQTFAAGSAAGALQSVIAAPLDALQVRFSANDMLEGKYTNMWQYARHKLHSIGLRGIFAGFTLSFTKDSLGAGIFFGTFEYVKSQCYYGFVTRYYGNYDPFLLLSPATAVPPSVKPLAPGAIDRRPIIKPHYALEPTFLLLAGVSASVTQQALLHPLTKLQNAHYARLESLDYQSKLANSRRDLFRLYYHAYEKTLAQCRFQARRSGGWRRWLYQGFFMGTVRQVPSTSAGLIVFELVRRKYAIEREEVRIEKDGYDILLR